MAENNTIHAEVLLLFNFDLTLFHTVSSFAMCCLEDGVEGYMLFCQVEIVAETL